MSRKFIQVEPGIKLETLSMGEISANQPTLVFLHSGLGSLELWRDFPQKVAEELGLSAVVYSRRGHGRSSGLGERRTPAYLHHEARTALPAVLKELGIQRPILVGHSDGATIALLFAAFFPDRPAALVIEAPHVFVEDVTIAGVKETRDIYASQLKGRLSKYHDDAEALFYAWADIWIDPAFLDWNIEEELKTITCPVLAIQGEADQYGTIRQVESIQRHTPRAEICMIPNCKHDPHIEHPAEVKQRIVQFLQSLNLTAPK